VNSKAARYFIHIFSLLSTEYAPISSGYEKKNKRRESKPRQSFIIAIMDVDGDGDGDTGPANER